MTAAKAYPGGGGQRGTLAAPLGDRVLPDPLDNFAEEHLRLREICARLDALVAAAPEPDRATATDALTHLQTALPRHVRDEEEDLFPLLRLRSQEDEEINDTLDRLAAEHVQSARLRRQVCAALERAIGSDTTVTPQEAAAVTAFAAQERRHLIVENAIVLPLARVRLTPQDLETLRRRMLQRRRAAAQEDPTC